jgi:hypothetical protein
MLGGRAFPEAGPEMFEKKDNENSPSNAQSGLESLIREFEILSESLEHAADCGTASRHYREMTAILDDIQDHYLSHELFEKYKLNVKSEGVVVYTPKKGESIHKLFTECNEYSQLRWGRPAVSEAVFAKVANDTERFAIAREIVGVVPGSQMKGRTEQGRIVTSQRLLIPTLDSAVAAGALYFCRTGRDLFAGLSVRTGGEVAIFLGAEGIDINRADRGWEALAGVACAGTPIVG